MEPDATRAAIEDVIVKTKIIGIIPARMGSRRFPGKPLASILGRPMIEHVYRRAARCARLDALYLATCDREIYEAVLGFGGKPVMTASTHERGTDRVAEAAAKVGGGADFVINIQGDEPLLRPEALDLLCQAMLDDPESESFNLASEIHAEGEFQDANYPKIVCDTRGYAMYISRESIPTARYLGMRIPKLRQLGIYGFRRDFLETFGRLPQTPLEQAESIDMLRILEHGYRLRVVVCPQGEPMVDTPEDLRVVEGLMKTDSLAAALGMNRPVSKGPRS